MEAQVVRRVVVAVVLLAVATPAHAGGYDNFLLCRDGNSACDPTLLTADEVVLVAAAADRRRFAACVDEAATCDMSGLTPEQVAQLSEARIQKKRIYLAPIINSGRNFALCVARDAACQSSLLTTEQRRTMVAIEKEQASANMPLQLPVVTANAVATDVLATKDQLKRFGLGLLRVLGEVAKVYLEVQGARAAQTPIVLSTGSGMVIAPDGVLLTTARIVESRIDGQFSGWTGETLFKLENGQIWQQASYAYSYRYAYRPRVIIILSRGGYEMHVDGVDQHIAVKRLK